MVSVDVKHHVYLLTYGRRRLIVPGVCVLVDVLGLVRSLDLDVLGLFRSLDLDFLVGFVRWI